MVTIILALRVEHAVMVHAFRAVRKEVNDFRL